MDIRLGSVISETEYYVKVEVMDNVEILFDDVFVEDDKVFNEVFNGDLFGRLRRDIIIDDGSIYESDDLGLIIVFSIS